MESELFIKKNLRVRGDTIKNSQDEENIYNYYSQLKMNKIIKLDNFISYFICMLKYVIHW